MDETGQVTDFSAPASLLVVVGRPYTTRQKELMLERLTKEFQRWDAQKAGCDLSEELEQFIPLLHTEPPNGSVWAHSTAKLSIVLLISPTQHEVRDGLHQFLASQHSCYRHLIYAGQAVSGSGCWMLSDGLFSYTDLTAVIEGIPDDRSSKPAAEHYMLAIGTFSEGNWTQARISRLLPHVNVLVNPESTLPAEPDVSLPLSRLLEHISTVVLPLSEDAEQLTSAEVVGIAGFKRPTLYIFPGGGDGNAALFGIHDLSVAYDAGYGCRPAFWDFVRHFRGLDSLIVSHAGADNLLSAKTFLERSHADSDLLPTLGHVIFNCPPQNTPLKATETQSLLVRLPEEVSRLGRMIHDCGLPLQPAACPPGGNAPLKINIYNKIGHGSVDLYVIHPVQDGRELKEFIRQCALQAPCFTLNGTIPMTNVTSIVGALVWTPCDKTERSIRILFPGAAPVNKVYEGLERLRGIEAFETPLGLMKDHGKKPVHVSKTGNVKPLVKALPVKQNSPRPDDRVHKITKDPSPSDSKKSVADVSSSVNGRTPTDHRTAKVVDTATPQGGRLTADSRKKTSGKPLETSKNTEVAIDQNRMKVMENSSPRRGESPADQKRARAKDVMGSKKTDTLDHGKTKVVDGPALQDKEQSVDQKVAKVTEFTSPKKNDSHTSQVRTKATPGKKSEPSVEQRSKLSANVGTPNVKESAVEQKRMKPMVSASPKKTEQRIDQKASKSKESTPPRRKEASVEQKGTKITEKKAEPISTQKQPKAVVSTSPKKSKPTLEKKSSPDAGSKMAATAAVDNPVSDDILEIPQLSSLPCASDSPPKPEDMQIMGDVNCETRDQPTSRDADDSANDNEAAVIDSALSVVSDKVETEFAMHEVSTQNEGDGQPVADVTENVDLSDKMSQEASTPGEDINVENVREVGVDESVKSIEVENAPDDQYDVEIAQVASSVNAEFAGCDEVPETDEKQCENQICADDVVAAFEVDVNEETENGEDIDVENVAEIVDESVKNIKVENAPDDQCNVEMAQVASSVNAEFAGHDEVLEMDEKQCENQICADDVADFEEDVNEETENGEDIDVENVAEIVDESVKNIEVENAPDDQYDVEIAQVASSVNAEFAGHDEVPETDEKQILCQFKIQSCPEDELPAAETGLSEGNDDATEHRSSEEHNTLYDTRAGCGNELTESEEVDEEVSEDEWVYSKGEAKENSENPKMECTEEHEHISDGAELHTEDGKTCTETAESNEDECGALDVAPATESESVSPDTEPISNEDGHDEHRVESKVDSVKDDEYGFHVESGTDLITDPLDSNFDERIQDHTTDDSESYGVSAEDKPSEDDECDLESRISNPISGNMALMQRPCEQDEEFETSDKYLSQEAESGIESDDLIHAESPKEEVVPKLDYEVKQLTTDSDLIPESANDRFSELNDHNDDVDFGDGHDNLCPANYDNQVTEHELSDNETQQEQVILDVEHHEDEETCLPERNLNMDHGLETQEPTGETAFEEEVEEEDVEKVTESQSFAASCLEVPVAAERLTEQTEPSAEAAAEDLHTSQAVDQVEFADRLQSHQDTECIAQSVYEPQHSDILDVDDHYNGEDYSRFIEADLCAKSEESHMNFGEPDYEFAPKHFNDGVELTAESAVEDHCHSCTEKGLTETDAESYDESGKGCSELDVESISEFARERHSEPDAESGPESGKGHSEPDGESYDESGKGQSDPDDPESDKGDSGKLSTDAQSGSAEEEPDANELVKCADEECHVDHNEPYEHGAEPLADSSSESEGVSSMNEMSHKPDAGTLEIDIDDKEFVTETDNVHHHGSHSEADGAFIAESGIEEHVRPGANYEDEHDREHNLEPGADQTFEDYGGHVAVSCALFGTGQTETDAELNTESLQQECKKMTDESYSESVREHSEPAAEFCPIFGEGQSETEDKFNTKSAMHDQLEADDVSGGDLANEPDAESYSESKGHSTTDVHQYSDSIKQEGSERDTEPYAEIDKEVIKPDALLSSQLNKEDNETDAESIAESDNGDVQSDIKPYADYTGAGQEVRALDELSEHILDEGIDMEGDVHMLNNEAEAPEASEIQPMSDQPLCDFSVSDQDNQLPQGLPSPHMDDWIGAHSVPGCAVREDDGLPSGQEELSKPDSGSCDNFTLVESTRYTDEPCSVSGKDVESGEIMAYNESEECPVDESKSEQKMEEHKETSDEEIDDGPSELKYPDDWRSFKDNVGMQISIRDQSGSISEPSEGHQEEIDEVQDVNSGVQSDVENDTQILERPLTLDSEDEQEMSGAGCHLTPDADKYVHEISYGNENVSSCVDDILPESETYEGPEQSGDDAVTSHSLHANEGMLIDTEENVLEATLSAETENEPLYLSKDVFGSDATNIAPVDSVCKSFGEDVDMMFTNGCNGKEAQCGNESQPDSDGTFDPLKEWSSPSGGDGTFDPLKEWGSPLGLPAPMEHGSKNMGRKQDEEQKKPAARAPSKTKAVEKTSSTPPRMTQKGTLQTLPPQHVGSKTAASTVSPNGKTHTELSAATTGQEKSHRSSRTAEGSSQKAPSTTTALKKSVSNKSSRSKLPSLFFDVAYIPVHGGASIDPDFFHRVRATHYVLSCSEPTKQILDSVIEGRKSVLSSPNDLPTTVIPTYESPAMLEWLKDNADELQRLKIEFAPAVNRCIIELQGTGASGSSDRCRAFCLEF